MREEEEVSALHVVMWELNATQEPAVKASFSQCRNSFLFILICVSFFITPVIRLEGPQGFGCPIDSFYGFCKLCGAWQISTWVKWKTVWPSVSLKQHDRGSRQHKAVFGRGEVSQLDQILYRIQACLCSLKVFKGIVHPKTNILTLFTHRHLVWNKKDRYLKECFYPENEKLWGPIDVEIFPETFFKISSYVVYGRNSVIQVWKCLKSE